MSSFRDRTDAGRRLAAVLKSDAAEHPIMLALPRGGITVGCEVVHVLDRARREQAGAEYAAA